MIFPEKEILLKDGRTALLRSPAPEDAEALLDYLRAVSGETDFLLRAPEEAETDPEKERAWVRGRLGSPDALVISSFLGGRVVGNCEIAFSPRKKTAHRATLAIALRREVWGIGLGSAMFSELIAAGEARAGVSVLELSCVEGNVRALALYEKFGFRTVCRRPNAFRLPDGSVCGELFLQREL